MSNSVHQSEVPAQHVLVRLKNWAPILSLALAFIALVGGFFYALNVHIEGKIRDKTDGLFRQIDTVARETRLMVGLMDLRSGRDSPYDQLINGNPPSAGVRKYSISVVSVTPSKLEYFANEDQVEMTVRLPILNKESFEIQAIPGNGLVPSIVPPRSRINPDGTAKISIQLMRPGVVSELELAIYSRDGQRLETIPVKVAPITFGERKVETSLVQKF